MPTTGQALRIAAEHHRRRAYVHCRAIFRLRRSKWDLRASIRRGVPVVTISHSLVLREPLDTIFPRAWEYVGILQASRNGAMSPLALTNLSNVPMVSRGMELWSEVVL